MRSAVMAAPSRLQPAIEQLTGMQKAAIVLMTMGPEAVAEVTQKMSPEELEAIGFEIARLEQVPIDVARAVVEEWEQMGKAAASIAQGGVEYARAVLEQAVGAQRAAAILKRIESQLRDSIGFQNLRNADPQQVSTLVRNEHPQTVALLLAHVDPAQAAAVLKELPASLGGDVLYRLASIEKVLPEVMQVLERSYGSESKLALSHDMSVAGGPASVAEVLNHITGTLEKELLDTLAQRDQDLCEKIKDLMFVFEDMLRLDDRALQRVLREIQAKELALALKAASDALRDRVTGSLSTRAAEALKEEIEFLGPVRLRDVETAQGNIVKIVRMLEEAGEIVTDTGDDDLVL